MDKASPRQRRHLDLIGQFTTDVRHVSGADNVVADTLSRIEQIEVSEAIDYSAIAKAQEQDEELHQLLNDVNSSLKFEEVQMQFNSNRMIYCDVSTGNARPFIPIDYRKQVFKSFHNLAHPGIKATVKLITEHVIWPSIKKDVKVMAQSCTACQTAKVGRHTKSPISIFKATDSRFSEVHLDIIGPLPISDNNRYCVTMIDRYTRWAEVIPVPNITAPTVAFAVFSGWIGRFGVPTFIVTDQGPQFESALFQELANLVGFERKRTTSYNPRCNGMIERYHRTLKAAIMCHNRADWTTILPSVLLGLRTVYRDELKSSSAEMVYGCTVRIPGQFLEKNDLAIPQADFTKTLKQHFNELRPAIATRHATEKIFVSRELENCSHVFLRTDALRKALQPPYTGPYAVITRFDKFYDIDLNGKTARISIDRLKPCFSESANDAWPNADSVKEHTTLDNCNAELPVPDKPSDKRVTFNTEPLGSSDPHLKNTRSGRMVNTPLRFR